MQRKTDLSDAVVDHMIAKTRDCLHPNPALRAKVVVNNKIMGTKRERYEHPELDLADSMTKYGNQLGKSSRFGQFGRRGKDTERVDTNQSADHRECMASRRKLEGRRLDYDCMKRKKSKGCHVADTDMKSSENKYNESYKLASLAMENLLDTEEDQMQHLSALSQALYDYHNCANVLRSLTTRLKGRTEPKSAVDLVTDVWAMTVNKSTEAVVQYNGVMGLMKLNGDINHKINTNDIFAKSRSIATKSGNQLRNISQNISQQPLRQEKPKCRALYDFESISSDKLSLKEGDVIELKNEWIIIGLMAYLTEESVYFP
ncbi:unnamed protein product [Oppiella nova]|uniref:SH3 domain-containing protein n=1 Tax=Oppiella nova TaxID=334625 RepID=A0A7R9MDF7_9ACAR|nr:unnamed protein product [Oppiella nova]CAG2174320.1 unnamed protein product [Oppiella nova]